MPFKRHNESITCWFSRLSFPHIWEPVPIMRQGVPIGEPRYSCLIILHDEIVERIRAIEARLIAQSWPEWPGRNPPAGVVLQRALKKGETVRPGDPNLAGKWVVSANAKKDSRPWVATKDPATGNYLPVTDHSVIYGGCEAHVSIGLYTTQIQAAAPQINVGLNGLEPTGRQLPSFENRISAEQAMAGGPDVAAPPVPAGGADVVAPSYQKPAGGADVVAPSHQEPAGQPAYDPSDPMTW